MPITVSTAQRNTAHRMKISMGRVLMVLMKSLPRIFCAAALAWVLVSTAAGILSYFLVIMLTSTKHNRAMIPNTPFTVV